MRIIENGAACVRTPSMIFRSFAMHALTADLPDLPRVTRRQKDTLITGLKRKADRRNI